MIRSSGTLSRALVKLAKAGNHWRIISRWHSGRPIRGIDTSHRTTAGRKYNKLLRLRFPRGAK